MTTYQGQPCMAHKVHSIVSDSISHSGLGCHTSSVLCGWNRNGNLGGVQLKGEVQLGLLVHGGGQLLRCSLAGLLHLGQGLGPQG